MSEREKQQILTEILGGYYISGEELLFYCPHCKHHKKKLSVNISKNAFKCWICDYSSSNIFKLVRKYGHHTQRIEWMKYSGEVEISSFSEKMFGEEEEEELEQIINLPEEFISLANKNLPYTAIEPLNYLKERNIDKKDIIKWKIGYCDSGKFAGRIIIPSFNRDGKCNYFIARTYKKDWKKYLNPNVKRDIIFNELFIDWNKDICLVEGVFDAIVSGTNSIPLLGSTLREDSKIFQAIINNETKIYVALDPDAEKKSMRLIQTLMKYGIEVSNIEINPYMDVGEMTKENFKDRKKRAKKQTQDSFLLQKITSV